MGGGPPGARGPPGGNRSPNFQRQQSHHGNAMEPTSLPYVNNSLAADSAKNGTPATAPPIDAFNRNVINRVIETLKNENNQAENNRTNNQIQSDVDDIDL